MFKPCLNAREPTAWSSFIDRYLETIFVDGGRGPTEFDCWGMAREVQIVTGVNPATLPAFGAVSASDKAGMTAAFHELSASFPIARIQPLSLALGFKGNRLWHIGTVIPDGSQLAVLHTSASFGPHITPLSYFDRSFTRTEYRYADAGVLSQ